MIDYFYINNSIPLNICNDKLISWKNGVFEVWDNIEDLILNQNKQRVSLFKTSHAESFSLYRRLFRKGPNFFVELESNYIFCEGNNIYSLSKDFKEKKQIFSSFRGSRPLNMNTDGKIIIFGEYFSNQNRGKVHLYKIGSNLESEIIYTFPKNTIRHIHNSIYSDTLKKWYILTGDNDSESGIFLYDIKKKQMTMIAGGSQRYRAVSIIEDNKSLIIPTDTPNEINYIQSYDLTNKKTKKLIAVNGSCFHTFKENNLYLISTVTEPSKINNSKYANIYGSLNGKNWFKLLSFKKDFFSISLQKYTRYSEIKFIKKSFSDYVICECRALKAVSHGLIAIKKKDLIDQLKVLQNEF